MTEDYNVYKTSENFELNHITNTWYTFEIYKYDRSRVSDELGVLIENAL